MSLSPGTFKTLCVLQLISIVIICLASPASSRQKKLKGPSKEALKRTIAQARSVQKPKDYEKIVQRAIKFDKHPQRVQEMDQRGPNPVQGRGYISNSNKLWKYSMLVVIDDAFSNKGKEEVTAAIYTLKKAIKCFDFKIVREGSLSSDVDHLHIKPRDDDIQAECASYLGRRGGKQVTVISSNCGNRYGVAMHEIMHALGFFHEHTRKDRDEYVEVHWGQLQSPGERLQYEIRDDQEAIGEYDFESIMHYPFDSELTPKVTIPNGITPGQRNHLSKLDIVRLNEAYPCRGRK